MTLLPRRVIIARVDWTDLGSIRAFMANSARQRGINPANRMQLAHDFDQAELGANHMDLKLSGINCVKYPTIVYRWLDVYIVEWHAYYSGMHCDDHHNPQNIHCPVHSRVLCMPLDNIRYTLIVL